MQNNTTGSSNTASGNQALRSNTSGNFNTALGSGADVSRSDLSNATAIDAGAIVTGSNKVQIGRNGLDVVAIGLKYDKLTVLLINAAKEQQAQMERQQEQIQRQQKDIDELKAALKSFTAHPRAENAELRARLDALERSMGSAAHPGRIDRDSSCELENKNRPRLGPALSADRP